MRRDELAEQVRRLAERVASLEASAGQPRGATALEPAIIERLATGTGPDTVRYGGAGRWGDDTLGWQRQHEWDDVRSRVDDSTARLFGALGNTVRLRIVAALLEGPATTAELTERLDQPSAGQLFHHLKELLIAGVIHQPVRATYAIRRQDVIPLLALLAAGTDLAAAGGSLEPA